jgi:hypothetical protein
MKHLETDLQKACVKWFRLQYPNHLINHQPNGGKRNAIEASKFKEMGTVPGWPDLFIPSIRLFIELKSEKGRLSENQINVIDYLKKNGYFVEVINNFEDFVKITNKYLNK